MLVSDAYGEMLCSGRARHNRVLKSATPVFARSAATRQSFFPSLIVPASTPRTRGDRRTHVGVGRLRRDAVLGQSPAQSYVEKRNTRLCEERSDAAISMFSVIATACVQGRSIAMWQSLDGKMSRVEIRNPSYGFLAFIGVFTLFTLFTLFFNSAKWLFECKYLLC